MVTNFLIYGLVNSAILMLSAIGFSLTFGLSGVANFAHGAIYLTAGFTAWMLINYLGLSPLVAMLITVVLMGILGALIYRIILMPVRGIVLSEVISTFALGVAMIEFFRWKGFVSFDFSLPPFMKGGIDIIGVTIDYQRLIIIGIAVIMAIFLWYFTHYTNTGLALRGMAQDEYTALCIGIESDWAAMLSLGLGAALAAVAAVAILPLGIISINMGYDIFLIALAVSVLGGLESTLGLFVGSLILGYAMVIASTYLGPQWGQVVYLGAIVIVLAIKPSGLFGKYKELEERV
ncbi:MAG: branched-chain amino acid ABC transporter permease [Desulfosporosinus sp. BRH_c37]|nr:MAG: branched-chain amino acid ABC transporter permease [Desulfosporosinus sp. BRH_c37]